QCRLDSTDDLDGDVGTLELFEVLGRCPVAAEVKRRIRCTGLRRASVGRWLLGHGLAPWQKGAPSTLTSPVFITGLSGGVPRWHRSSRTGYVSVHGWPGSAPDPSVGASAGSAAGFATGSAAGSASGDGKAGGGS